MYITQFYAAGTDYFVKKARYKYQIWNHLKNEIVRQKNLTFYYKNRFF